jgi:hypothetical protein
VGLNAIAQTHNSSRQNLPRMRFILIIALNTSVFSLLL